MKLIAITGISRDSIAELKRRRLLTFEFHSANNLIAFAELRPGDPVFITESTPSDVNEGLCGTIATIKSIDTRMQQTSYSASGYTFETESMSVRAQLAVGGTGKVRSIEEVKFLKPVVVDAIEVKFCEAK